MTIRKITGATSAAVVKTTATQSGIFKATTVQTSGIQSLKNLTSILIPKVANTSPDLIDGIRYDPDGGGLRSIREYLTIGGTGPGRLDPLSGRPPELIQLLVGKPVADQLTAAEQIIINYAIGRNPTDIINSADEFDIRYIGAIVRGFGEFVAASDFFLITRILDTVNDSIFAADNQQLFIDKLFADDATMVDLMDLFDGLQYTTILGRFEDQPITEIFSRIFTAIRNLDSAAPVADLTALFNQKPFVDNIGNADVIQTLANKLLNHSVELNSAQALQIFKSLADATIMLDDAAVGDNSTWNYEKLIVDLTQLQSQLALLAGKSLTSDQLLLDALSLQPVKSLADAVIAQASQPVLFNNLGRNDAAQVTDDDANLDIIKALFDQLETTEQLAKYLSLRTSDSLIEPTDQIFKYEAKPVFSDQELTDTEFFSLLKPASDQTDITQDLDLLTNKSISDSVVDADQKLLFFIFKSLADAVSVVQDETELFDGIAQYKILTKIDDQPVLDYFARAVRYFRRPDQGFRSVVSTSSITTRHFFLQAKSGARTNVDLIRTNYITYSEQFNFWQQTAVLVDNDPDILVPLGISRNITYDATQVAEVLAYSTNGYYDWYQLAPLPGLFNQSSADRITETAVAGAHEVYLPDLSLSASLGQDYAFAIYLKPAGRNLVEISTALGGWARIDITGLVVQSSTAATASVQLVNNGWVLCTLQGQVSTATDAVPRIRLLDAAGNSSYTGDGTSGIYAWGAQLESGDQILQEISSLTYVPTAGQAASAFGYNNMSQDRDRVFAGSLHRQGGTVRFSGDPYELITLNTDLGKFETLVADSAYTDQINYRRSGTQDTTSDQGFIPIVVLGSGINQRQSDLENISFILLTTVSADTVTLGTANTGIRNSGDALENFSFWLDKLATFEKSYLYFNNLTGADPSTFGAAVVIGSASSSQPGNSGIYGGGGSGANNFYSSPPASPVGAAGGLSSMAPVWFYAGEWYGPAGGAGGAVYRNPPGSDPNIRINTRNGAGGGGGGVIQSDAGGDIWYNRAGNGLAVISYVIAGVRASRVWHSNTTSADITTTWSVPAGVSEIDIEVIGAGADSTSVASTANDGGGGGGFAGKYSVAVSSNQTIYIKVAAVPASVTQTTANLTWININSNTTPSVTGTGVVAFNGFRSTGGQGLLGDRNYKGGNGGLGSFGANGVPIDTRAYGNGGGGGAAGPIGPGGNGGNGVHFTPRAPALSAGGGGGGAGLGNNALLNSVSAASGGNALISTTASLHVSGAGGAPGYTITSAEQSVTITDSTRYSTNKKFADIATMLDSFSFGDNFTYDFLDQEFEFVTIGSGLDQRSTELENISYWLNKTAKNGVYQGTLINWLLYSEQLENASGWNASATRPQANTQTAPDGTLTADNWFELNIAGRYSLSAVATVYSTPALGSSYTVSCYIKKGTGTLFPPNRRYVQFSGFGLHDAAEAPVFDVNTSTAAVYTATTTSVLKSASLTPVGNGWYRCQIDVVSASSSSAQTFTMTLTEDPNIRTLPALTSGIAGVGVYLWGAQMSSPLLDNSLNGIYVSTTATVAEIPFYNYDTDSVTITDTAPGQFNKLLIRPLADDVTMIDAFSFGDNFTYDFLDQEFEFVTIGSGEDRRSADLEPITFDLQLTAKAGIDYNIEGFKDLGFDFEGESESSLLLFVSEPVSAADTDRVIAFDLILINLLQFIGVDELLLIEDFIDKFDISISKADSVSTPDIRTNVFLKVLEDTRSYYRQPTADVNLLNELFYNTGTVLDPTLTPVDGNTTYIDQYNWYSIVPLTDPDRARFALGNNNNELGVEITDVAPVFFISKQFDETYPMPGQGSNTGPLMVDSFSFGDNFTYDFLDQEFDFITIGSGLDQRSAELEHAEFLVLKTALTGLGADRTVSGTTVTAADTDRIFVGQQYGDVRLSGDPLENLSYVLTFEARAGVDYTIDGSYDIGFLYRDPEQDALQILEIINRSEPLNNYNNTWYSPVPLTARAESTLLTTSALVTARDLDRIIAFDQIGLLLGQLRNIFETVDILDFVGIDTTINKTDATVIESNTVKFINKGINDTKSYYRQPTADADLLNELFYNNTVTTDPQLVPLSGSTTYKDQHNWYSLVPLTDSGADFAFGTNNELGVAALDDQSFFIDKHFDETYPAGGQGINIGPLMVDAFSFGDNFTYDFLDQEFDTILIGSGADTRASELELVSFWMDNVRIDQAIMGRSEGFRVSGSDTEKTALTLLLDAKTGVEHTITGNQDIGYLFRQPTFDANQILELNLVSNPLNQYNSTWYSELPYFERLRTSALLVEQTIPAQDRDLIIAFDLITVNIIVFRELLEELLMQSQTQLLISRSLQDAQLTEDVRTNVFLKQFEETRSIYRNPTADAGQLLEFFDNTETSIDSTLVLSDTSTSRIYYAKENWYSIVPLSSPTRFAYGINNELGPEILEEFTAQINYRRRGTTDTISDQGFTPRVTIGGSGGRRVSGAELENISYWLDRNLTLTTTVAPDIKYYDAQNINLSVTLLNDTFETVDYWYDYNSGVVTQSSTQAHTGTFSLKKTSLDDPNGGVRTLTGDWRISTFIFANRANLILEVWLYSESPRVGGTRDRIAIVDANFNGYGFGVSGNGLNTLDVERRDTGIATIISTVTMVKPENAWYRVELLSNANNTFTVNAYADTGILIGTITSVADTTHTGPFDRVLVVGGRDYYVDDLVIKNSVRVGGQPGNPVAPNQLADGNYGAGGGGARISFAGPSGVFNNGGWSRGGVPIWYSTSTGTYWGPAGGNGGAGIHTGFSNGFNPNTSQKLSGPGAGATAYQMGGNGLAVISYSGNNIVFSTTGNSTWTVPVGVTSIDIAVIGSGGNAQGSASLNARGGGGFAGRYNVSVSPGSSVHVQVANTTNAGVASSSWVNISGTNAAPINVSQGVLATGSTSVTGGAGVHGQVKYSGGNGGTSHQYSTLIQVNRDDFALVYSWKLGGGGGAAGPDGPGRNGFSVPTTTGGRGGGGGGANGGGAATSYLGGTPGIILIPGLTPDLDNISTVVLTDRLTRIADANKVTTDLQQLDDLTKYWADKQTQAETQMLDLTYYDTLSSKTDALEVADQLTTFFSSATVIIDLMLETGSEDLQTETGIQDLA